MPVALQGVDPWFVDKTINPREARAALAYLYGVTSAGVVEGGVLPGAGLAGLSVSATTPSASMAVTVAAGSCFVPRTGGEHGYICRLTTAGNVTIDAADLTNPRIDLIVARVRDVDLADPVNALGTRGFAIEYEKGTAAAVPVPKDLSATPPHLVLAEVRVDAGVSSIVAGKITDRRYFTRAAGAPRIDLNDGGRSGNGLWDLRQRHSTGALETWDTTLAGGAGAWTPLASPRAWTAYTPTVTMATPNGVATGRYWRSGRRVSAQCTFVAGAGVSLGSFAVTFTLPFATANVNNLYSFGSGFWASGAFKHVSVLALPNATTAEVLALGAGNTLNRPGNVGYTFVSGDVFVATLEYECAAV